MNNSQSKKATVRRLVPRKTPSQPRSAHTVGTILEGAAHILEQYGLEGYTTNAIAARAGVSIGSLYQYFPTKDAVTIALIERESLDLVHEASAALQGQDHRRALRELVEIGIRYQLRRPQLAKLLDTEQGRLASLMPGTAHAAAMRAALTGFLATYPGLDPARAGRSASDLMALISALTDAAGRVETAISPALADPIEGAVLGYLNAVSITVS
ncbi:TetR/AcrR family transcriptional regulator [Massilia antarctica]|uniref:TetR/AcrR family transcriptional regulator n=1 Tax=Massilia antarctica TaxID=2765360 RepID=UPI0006BB87FC|nr:TetR/AcrR family transcriptional regulator [Massilia sp. H27-R4]MCY0914553.1 TetR/AcrR family transcriptional regulator [Massilia sp. H27-R4]CUI03053.1 Transcriptional regulator, TetR family [Janthinobacterium sp. CG23_2]CUU26839.1 Transcriptional regulator, TetR family [Janthinobacterium sp. CG23_2]